MKKLMALVAAIAMVAGFTMTAAAAEWNFYGSARVTTFYQDWDGEDFVLASTGDDDDFDLTHAVQGNSRIGARVKVSDELSGRFEYGTGVNLRLLYGTWNFGSGKLTAGQFYSPLNMFYSSQVWGSDNNMLNFGGVYGGRQQGIQLQFGAFKIAFLNPVTNTIAGGDPDQILPKIEASYHLALGDAFIDLQGGYQTNEIELAGASDEDVDCYVLAIGGGMNFGNMYLKGNFFYGQNVGNYGLYHAGADDAVYVGGDVEDNDSWGFLIVAGAKLSDMLSVEAGYGYTESELDVSGANEDDTSAYYVQCTVNLAPGVFIVPEIGYIDGGEDAAGADEPDTMYYGLKWQINF